MMASKAGEILDPMTGELVASDDVEALIDLFERLVWLGREISNSKRRIRRAMGALANRKPGPASINMAQKLELRRIKSELGIGIAQWRSLLRIYGVATAHELDFDQANELVGVLQGRRSEESDFDVGT